MQGGTVVAAARDYAKSHDYLSKLKASLPKDAADRISFEALDLADLDSVRAFAKRYLDSGRNLDVLINNAVSRRKGEVSFVSLIRLFSYLFVILIFVTLICLPQGIMALPERAVSAQGHELQMATNHYGHSLLTFLLLDKIKETSKKNGGARIINVSSGAHAQGAIDFDDIGNERSYKAWKTYGDTKLVNVMMANGLAWKELKGTDVVANSL